MNISFEGLKKSYDGRTVLDIAEGHIKSGSRTAIIGPNGAGKSTLVKIIAGIESADEGFIRYYTSGKQVDNSVDAKSEAESAAAGQFPKMDITLVFQKPYLFSTTVEKNIAYPMKIRGFSEDAIEQRVSELLSELNLTEFRKQKAWKLSGGETQKVALARALSFKPKLLVLDEPTANIDPYSTAEIEKMLLSIGKKQDTTIVLITHNLAQAKRVCDKAMMLHEGKLIESGDCSEVLAQPDNIQTKRFIEGELLI